MNSEITCPECNGAKHIFEYGICLEENQFSCPTCNGTGKVPALEDYLDMLIDDGLACPKCFAMVGEGEQHEDNCPMKEG